MNNMYYNYAFVIAYIINVFLAVNNTALKLSYGHRKRELSFNNYPTSSPLIPHSQPNEIDDPGYTAQHENDDEKTISGERNVNLTNAQNFAEFLNPPGQMFHLIYMPFHPHKRQQMPAYQDQRVSLQQNQQPDGNSQNLLYAGPHLFPAQLPNQYQNTQQLNVPFRNVNAAFPNQLFMKPHLQNFFKDSKVQTNMEAPFIPSQFLGYSQQQNQQLPQQQQQQPQQQLLQQNQQLLQVNGIKPQQQQQQNQQLQQQLQQQNQQLVTQYYQQSLKPAPVHEPHENSPYPSPNLIYMPPNNIYHFYQKPI